MPAVSIAGALLAAAAVIGGSVAPPLAAPSLSGGHAARPGGATARSGGPVSGGPVSGGHAPGGHTSGPAALVAPAPSSLAAEVRAAEQPQLSAIKVPAAWRMSRGRGVIVGVLDTGVDTRTPDLAGSVVTGPDYTRGADPPGYHPPHLHGTYIASLIAGHGHGAGDAGGVIGVAPRAEILSVRVLLDDGEPGFAAYNEDPRYRDAIGRGIRYAVNHGARVINMSLGSPDANRGTQSALAYAAAHNVVVVAAAGNSARPGQRFTPYSYPAAYPGVISVAAVSLQGQRASFSDRNASVVLSAPGVKIIGDAPGTTYLEGSGTSPASAFVAGVAALIRSAYPHLSAPLVEQALIVSARRRPAAGYRETRGFGEVDAVAALRAARRLARQRRAAGVAPSAHAVAGRLRPIQVVHRDAALIGTYLAISGAGVLGFLACLVLLALLIRSARRERRALRTAPVPVAPSGPAQGAGHAGSQYGGDLPAGGGWGDHGFPGSGWGSAGGPGGDRGGHGSPGGWGSAGGPGGDHGSHGSPGAGWGSAGPPGGGDRAGPPGGRGTGGAAPSADTDWIPPAG